MTSLPNQTTVFVSIQHVIDLIFKRCEHFILLLILLMNTGLGGQTTVGTITTASPSCSLMANICESDTLTLIPQNRTNYTNYKWYLGAVAPVNQITATTAIASNVVATGFSTNFPTIRVISNGGIYIMTGEYSTGTGCITINDTVTISFSKRPIVQTVVDKTIVCVGGSVTLNATLLAGSGTCNFQWQNSTDGINWFNIQGATNNTFITSPLSNSTRYRAQAICSGNACCN